MSIEAEIKEDEYRIAGSFAQFWTPGEYGPLPCGCCVVAAEFDPVGPSLCLILTRKDADHSHTSAEDFQELRP